MTALYKTMTEGDVPEAASGLIEAVVAEIEDSKDAKEKLKLPETKQSATQAAQLVHQLGLDLEVLDQKSTPEETRAFKDWLIQIADISHRCSTRVRPSVWPWRSADPELVT